MVNRWQGNTGRVERIDETRLGQNLSRPAQPNTGGAFSGAGMAGTAGGGIGAMLQKLSSLIPGTREPLESDDIILLLILYLMYRESGDGELLIIMGAMFLL